jgi:predicted DsbA family dithiol-disulfide isomerase
MRTHHPDRFEAFDEALFRAFFQECRDISDRAVLAELAGGEVGYAEREEVAAEHRSAVELGIHSIPSVVIGREVISGAVAYEEYLARVP